MNRCCLDGERPVHHPKLLRSDTHARHREHTSGGTISPPFSVANGSAVSVTGSVSGTTTLCNIRYQKSNGGCQFQVQVNGFTGLASTNAYKGTATCTKLNEGSTGSNSYQGSFRMQ